MGIIVPSRRVIAPKISEYEIDWSQSITRGLYFFANLGAGAGAPVGFDGSRTSFTFGSSLPQLQGYGRFTNHVIKLDKSVPAGGLASVLCKFRGYTSGNGRLVDCDYDSGVWLGPGGSGTFGGGFSVGGSPYGQYTSPNLAVPNVIGVVRTGSTASLSVNGVEVSAQSNPTAWTSGNRIAIGGTAAGASERIVADIEWVALWTRPLTAAETLVVSRDPYGSLLKRRQARRVHFIAPVGGATRDIAGTCSVVVGGSGAVDITRPIAGTSAAAFGASGEIQYTRSIAGTCSVTTGGTGEVQVARSIAGTAAVAFGGTGTISVGNDLAIAGTCAVAVGGSGEIIVSRQIAGTSTAIFSGSGQLIVTRSIAGSCAVIFTGTGTVTNAGPFVEPRPACLAVGSSIRRSNVRNSVTILNGGTNL